ncbi:MAG: hypothetical protein NVS9B11_15290 [Candidatus Dormibacteraceae bacterium]
MVPRTLCDEIRSVEVSRNLIGATLIIALGAGCTGSAPATVPAPVMDRPAPASASPLPIAPAPYGNARFFFEPGPIIWCGFFVAYREPTANGSGELQLGATTFALSSGNLTAYPQRLQSDVRPGVSACVQGTIVRSETTANLLSDLTVTPAPFGALPHNSIRASACGVIGAVSVDDLAAGGFITLDGTTFLVGGVRPAGDAVQLTPSELRVGVNLCLLGTTLTRASAAATFEAIGGRAALMLRPP